MKIVRKYQIASILVFLFLVILYVLSFIQPIFYTNNWWHRLLVTFRFVFVNEHDRLNWVGISAIGVMISYAVNSKFSRDKLKADIISSARIKWIQDVRELTSEYIVSSYDVINLMSPLNNVSHIMLPQTEEDTDKYIKSLVQKKSDLKNISEKLSLYFGPDSSGINQTIKQFIYNYTETLIMTDGGDPVFFLNLKNDSENLRDYLSFYYKIEWQRSNGSILDSEVDDKLKNSEFVNLEKRTEELAKQVKENEKNKKEEIQAEMNSHQKNEENLYNESEKEYIPEGDNNEHKKNGIIEKICNVLQKNFNQLVITCFLGPFMGLALIFIFNYAKELSNIILFSLSLEFLYSFFILSMSLIFLLSILVKLDLKTNEYQLEVSKSIVKWIFVFIYLLSNFYMIIEFVTDGIPQESIVFTLFIINSYIYTFGIVKIIMTTVMRLKKWFFSDSNDNAIKSKLSFMNKIIVGFISIIGSILAIILTIKQLFS